MALDDHLGDASNSHEETLGSNNSGQNNSSHLNPNYALSPISFEQ